MIITIHFLSVDLVYNKKCIEQIMIWSSRWYMLQNQILDLQTMIFLLTYRGWDAVQCIRRFDFLLQ